MGTLLNQLPRNHKEFETKHVESFLDDVIKIATDKKMYVADVLKAYEIMEMKRRNDLYVANGDIKDEQLAGFGELLTEFVGHISVIARYVNDKTE